MAMGRRRAALLVSAALSGAPFMLLLGPTHPLFLFSCLDGNGEAQGGVVGIGGVERGAIHVVIGTLGPTHPPS